MKKDARIQYTIRHIPPALDRALRQKVKREKESLNACVIDALTKGLGMADQPVRYHDLDELAGTWREDALFDAAIAAQNQIDHDLWK
jgi:hypothetical protein